MFYVRRNGLDGIDFYATFTHLRISMHDWLNLAFEFTNEIKR